MRKILNYTLFFFLTTAVHLCFAQQSPESVLITAGDKLQVHVFDTPEMDQHPRVTDAGTIPVMLVGEIKVSGLTPAQAAAAIEAALKEKQIMRQPQVSVVMDEHEAGEIYIMGQVKDPGAYEISTPISVIKALSLAGGLTELADRHVTIQHQNDPSQKLSYFVANNAGEALDTNVTVYPGDTIVIPKTGIVYVLGDVARPGGYPMASDNSKITLMQALAMAGSTNKTAITSGTKLIRRTANGPEEIPIAISAIQKGKQPDVELQANDMLFVPFSWMKNLFLTGSSIAASATSAAIYAKP